MTFLRPFGRRYGGRLVVLEIARAGVTTTFTNMCGHRELDLDIDSAVEGVVPIRGLRMRMFTRDSGQFSRGASQNGGASVHRPDGARTRRGSRRVSGATPRVCQ